MAIDINAGDGNNNIRLVSSAVLATNHYSRFSANVITGSGNDTIVAVAGINNTITSGAGNDTVTAGQGTILVSLGAGADKFILENVTYGAGDVGQVLTLTDFNFAEGDTFVFQNFGADFGDDSVDPANALVYDDTYPNTWTVDSIEDFRELRDGGAITVTALVAHNGSTITFLDGFGHSVSVDLWGVLI